MKRHSETVSFRASEDLLRLIDAARAPFGISRGDWVRGVIQSQILSPRGAADRPNSAIEAEQILASLQRVQGQLPRLLFVLLTQIGNLNADTAKEIARKTFPS